MSYERYEELLVTVADRIATVTINRPQSLNAITERLHHELSTIFSNLAEDPEVAVIVLTGAGRAFSAGGDLQWVKAQVEGSTNFFESFKVGRRIVMGLLDCAKPIVCRLNGDAIGIGATIALLSDIIVAVDTARIADPHVRIGLVAGDGGALIWPQLVGFAKAKEFLLTGNAVMAPEAARIGLINQAVSEAELDGAVARFVGKLLSASQPAVRYTKACINIPLRQMVSGLLDASMACEGVTLLQRDDIREGVAAFSEGRPPKFTAR